jgi:uncharacterized protein (DUF1800 family)
VELGVGLLRVLELETDFNALANQLSELGQQVFFPPSVKGWDGGRSWINSATILGRTNLVRAAVQQADLTALTDKANLRTATDIVAWAESTLLATPLSSAVREQVLAASEQASSPATQAARALTLLGGLPEFQLN